jgi:hypothetical protein
VALRDVGAAIAFLTLEPNANRCSTGFLADLRPAVRGHDDLVHPPIELPESLHKREEKDIGNRLAGSS